MGMSATQAYRVHVSEGRCSTETAMANGCALLAKLRLRVDELRKKASEKAEEKFGVTVETLIRFHLDVIETPIQEIDGNNRLAQEHKTGKDGVTIKSVSKATSAVELAKLCGWYAPEKSEVIVAETTPEELANRVQSKALELHGKSHLVAKILNPKDPTP